MPYLFAIFSICIGARWQCDINAICIRNTLYDNTRIISNEWNGKWNDKLPYILAVCLCVRIYILVFSILNPNLNCSTIGAIFTAVVGWTIFEQLQKHDAKCLRTQTKIHNNLMFEFRLGFCVSEEYGWKVPDNISVGNLKMWPDINWNELRIRRIFFYWEIRFKL